VTRGRTTDALWTARWRGQSGRLEVWYTTLTDPDTGTGVWLHHEVVAPTDGSPAHALGWAAVFRPGVAPVHGRFGPVPHQEPAGGDVFTAAEVSVAPDRLRGSAGDIHWDLRSAAAANRCSRPQSGPTARSTPTGRIGFRKVDRCPQRGQRPQTESLSTKRVGVHKQVGVRRRVSAH
jgi:hypothetical protein